MDLINKNINKSKICLVVPIFNNENSIKLLYNTFKEIVNNKIKINYKLILVDDNSSDNSIGVIREICMSDPNVTGIFLSKNFGQAAALCAGFDNSDGDYFGTIDGDLEDPPEIVSEMFDHLKDDKFDIVIAERASSKVTIFRKITSYISYFIFRIGTKDAPKKSFSVWLMNKKIFKHFSRITNGFPQIEIYELGFRKKIISYERQKSKNFKSNQNIFELFDNFFELIIATSAIIFKIIFVLASLIFLLSILNILYMFFQYFNNTGNVTRGLPAILTYISFFGSLNLLFLGMIGIYLLKLKNNKNNKYYIQEIINNSK
jgi:dolichol-phosphate mannosyltransferase